MLVKARFILRQDLGLSPGKIGAQVGHGVDFIHLYQADNKSWYDEWLEADRVKIVQRIKSAEKLENLIAYLRQEGVAHHPIVDLGLTELSGITKTGVVIYPRPDHLLPKKVLACQIFKE